MTDYDAPLLKTAPSAFETSCAICIAAGCTVSDLSGTVIGPRIYKHEDIPSALAAQKKYSGCWR